MRNKNEIPPCLNKHVKYLRRQKRTVLHHHTCTVYPSKAPCWVPGTPGPGGYNTRCEDWLMTNSSGRPIRAKQEGSESPSQGYIIYHIIPQQEFNGFLIESLGQLFAAAL